MRLASINPGDIVECDVRGDVFLGRVDHVAAGELEVKPVVNGRGRVRLIRARQVKAHWRRAGHSRGGAGDERS